MRYFRLLFFVIILGLVVYPFACLHDNDSRRVSGLPWQIEILPGGLTRVFGIVPGRSSLKEAAASLGDDYELAVVENSNDTSLEMFYGHYRAGLMTAKMVLVGDVSEAVSNAWKQRATKTSYMESGTARKYSLAEADRAQAMRAIVRAITLIPSVNLDDDSIRRRFGEPSDTVQRTAGVTHYLYADRGLAIALSDEKKDVLQYVAPDQFSRLRDPLLE